MSQETVEINGVKFEVDMDTAKRIDTFKVGDNVRLLDKRYNSSEIYTGVILGFYNFKELPTIQVAYFKDSFSGATIDFVNINSKSDDFELLPSNKYEADFDRDTVVGSLNQQIESKTSEMKSLEAKKAWFLKYYGKYFVNDGEEDANEEG
ncbi:hypothetical protein ACR64M_00585 [Lactiplantibacillus plantarum]|uniref:hypothetical protein n=1 Tax=Lactiplantibacillus plantarum TaxID=1590 RepID=UPI003F496D0C